MSTANPEPLGAETPETVESPEPPKRVQEIKVWKAPQAVASTSGQMGGPSLPESYFQPTAGELKSAYDGQVKAREKLVGGALRTGVARERELEEQRRRNKHPTTRVRIRFADRTQIETTFPSSAQLPAVYAFTKSALAEHAAAKSFILYQAPPRREFKTTDPKLLGKTLYDLQLVPTAVLYIKFEDESLNDTKKSPPIDPSLLEEAVELPAPPNFDPTTADLAVLTQTQKADAAKASKKSDGTKAPKWLSAMTKKK